MAVPGQHDNEMRKHILICNDMPRLQSPALLCWLLALMLQACTHSASLEVTSRPEGFVDLQQFIPTVVLDVRYAGIDNFVGEPIRGYQAKIIYLSREAATALHRVQAELADVGLGLKVFDGYRPQRAVNHFVSWAEDLEDTRMQSRYYPSVSKAHLFRDGYISARSGHSRGSTVDLTLVQLDTGEELDMGSSWDYFDPVSWPDSKAVSPPQYANRMRLREVMNKFGFNPARTEWWHFTLREEPYPDQYFDFVIGR